MTLGDLVHIVRKLNIYLATFTDDMSKYIITCHSYQLFYAFSEPIALYVQSYLMPTGALQGTVLSTLRAHN